MPSWLSLSLTAPTCRMTQWQSELVTAAAGHTPSVTSSGADRAERRIAMTARSVTNCARQTMRWLASEGLIELSGAGQTASSYHCRPGRQGRLASVSVCRITLVLRQGDRASKRHRNRQLASSQKLSQKQVFVTRRSATYETIGHMTPAKAKTGAQLGYARVSTGHQSLDQQLDALHSCRGRPRAHLSRQTVGHVDTRAASRPGRAAGLRPAR